MQKIWNPKFKAFQMSSNMKNQNALLTIMLWPLKTSYHLKKSVKPITAGTKILNKILERAKLNEF